MHWACRPGHSLLAFVKMPTPEATHGAHFKFTTSLHRIGVKNLSVYSSALYVPPKETARNSGDAKLKFPGRVLVSAAHACRRADLMTTDVPEEQAWQFKKVTQEVEHECGKSSYWEQKPKVEALHKHIYALAVAAAKAQDAAKGTTHAADLAVELPVAGR